MTSSLSEVFTRKNFIQNSFNGVRREVEDYFFALERIGIDSRKYITFIERTLFTNSNSNKIQYEFFNKKDITNGVHTHNILTNCASAQTFFITHKNVPKGKRIYILNVPTNNLKKYEARLGVNTLKRKIFHELTHVLSFNCYVDGTILMGIIDSRTKYYRSLNENSINVINEAIANSIAMILYKTVTGKDDFLEAEAQPYTYLYSTKYIYSILSKEFTEKEIVELYFSNEKETLLDVILNKYLCKNVNENMWLLEYYNNLVEDDNTFRKLMYDKLSKNDKFTRRHADAKIYIEEILSSAEEGHTKVTSNLQQMLTTKLYRELHAR